MRQRLSRIEAFAVIGAGALLSLTASVVAYNSGDQGWKYGQANCGPWAGAPGIRPYKSALDCGVCCDLGYTSSNSNNLACKAFCGVVNWAAWSDHYSLL